MKKKKREKRKKGRKEERKWEDKENKRTHAHRLIRKKVVEGGEILGDDSEDRLDFCAVGAGNVMNANLMSCTKAVPRSQELYLRSKWDFIFHCC